MCGVQGVQLTQAQQTIRCGTQGMSTHSVEITSNGKLASIVLDGQDIAPGVQSYELRHAVGQLPELELTPHIVTGQVASVEADVIVYLPDEAITALLAAGWTPPEDKGSP